MPTDLDLIECPICGNEFSVYAIKFQGYDPHETNTGQPLCSTTCYANYLESLVPCEPCNYS